MKAKENIGGGGDEGATLANVSIGEHYRVNANAVLSYLLKGADAATAGELGLTRYGEAGPIIGKRAGWTQNIGEAARERWRDDRK